MAGTLTEARDILTVRNRIKYLVDGSKTQGTQVVALRRNEHGHYIPCMAHIRKVTPSGRFTVDLWEDRSERVTVSRDAILWNPAATH